MQQYIARPKIDLIRDRRGIAAVEFAILALPFFAMIFGIFQFGLLHFYTNALDHATRMAARQIMLGKVQEAKLDKAAFKSDVLCPRLGGMLQCDRIVASVQVVDPVWTAARTTGVYKFIQTATPALVAPAADDDAAKYCLGGSGATIFVDVTYKLPVSMTLLWPSSGYTVLDGERVAVLRATSVASNERFTATGASC